MRVVGFGLVCVLSGPVLCAFCRVWSCVCFVEPGLLCVLSGPVLCAICWVGSCVRFVGSGLVCVLSGQVMCASVRARGWRGGTGANYQKHIRQSFEFETMVSSTPCVICLTFQAC